MGWVVLVCFIFVVLVVQCMHDVHAREASSPRRSFDVGKTTRCCVSGRMNELIN